MLHEHKKDVRTLRQTLNEHGHEHGQGHSKVQMSDTENYKKLIQYQNHIGGSDSG